MGPEYFEYLKNRGRLKLFLRRRFLLPVVKFFTGRVLDIGSGIGEFLSLYPDSVGIDIDEASVTFCRERGLECSHGDIYHLPFEEDSFDGILLNNVLEHLERPDDAFFEIKRVLRHKGKLLIEVPGKKGFLYDKTHLLSWEKENTSALVERWGFREIKTCYFPIPLKKAGDYLTHNKLRLTAINYKQS